VQAVAPPTAYVPGRHGVKVARPGAAQAAPAGHGRHADTFPGLYVPAAHAAFRAGLAGCGHAYPGGQGRHAALPAGATVPPGQGRTTAAVVEGQAWPAGQATHVPFPATEKEPAGQGPAIDPDPHPYPAGHAVQLDAPAGA
jgi:hypothetical protein